MTISDTTVIPDLKVGYWYGFSLTGLDAGHTTSLQYEDSNGYHTITGTELSGADDQDHMIFVTSSNIKVLVLAGTGDIEVNFTRDKSSIIQ